MTVAPLPGLPRCGLLHVMTSLIVTSLVMTSLVHAQWLSDCQLLCDQGIVTNDCDCSTIFTDNDVILNSPMSEPQSMDVIMTPRKRQANTDVYNRIFKWGKRRGLTVGERSVAPVDNIERRIFRWGKRSGGLAAMDAPEDMVANNLWPAQTPDIQSNRIPALSRDPIMPAQHKRAGLFSPFHLPPSSSNNRRLGALQRDLRQLLAEQRNGRRYSRSRLVYKRPAVNRDVYQSRIFKWGKRSDGGDAGRDFRTAADKRETRKEDLRKIFMWG